jgi:calcineurin-like phosphoesterase family protein
MPNIWFTSDTHFGHYNIIKYCNRPFKDTVEMNETIIRNWNNVVKETDFVYHLGDFAYGKDVTNFDMYFNRLNGFIVLIEGNHDQLASMNKHKFYSYKKMHEIRYNDQDVILCHYAMRIWNKSHHGAWHLYGHSHGTLPDDIHALSFDVGVDCHNFTPISFERVKEIMDKKKYETIDHHGRLEKHI